MKNYPVSQPLITELDVHYVNLATKSGWVSSLGEYLDIFEKKFAEFCGVKYCILTSNGTCAIQLALLSMNLKAGDEVIIPDLTFVATANAVVHAGGIPVFADILPDSLNIDPQSVERLITPKTKVIIAVHLYGHPAKMDLINIIAKKHNLFVIEDAAEAHGAEFHNKIVGGLADCATFSFYGNKIITTGEGGAITTNSDLIYNKAKFLRDHAMSSDRKYWHEEIGFNFRMTNLQAALGYSQLLRVESIINERSEIFKWYKKHLLLNESVRLNLEEDEVKNVIWLVRLEIDFLDEERRNNLMIDLKKLGVDTRPYFYPMSLLPMYKNNVFENKISTMKYDKGINLPTYLGLSELDVKNISEIVNKILY